MATSDNGHAPVSNVVRVTIPASVAYNFDSITKVTQTVLGKLGCLGGRAPDDEGRNMDHLCLSVTGYDEAAIVAHLQAHHVRLGSIGSRYGARGEGPSIYCFDPEGNMVELKGPPYAG